MCIALQIYKSNFNMHHLVLYSTPTRFNEIRNAQMRRAVIVADYVIQGWIVDMKTFVAEATEESLCKINAARDAAERALFLSTDAENARREALRLWKVQSHPFDHTNAAGNLPRIVNVDGTAGRGLPPHDVAKTRSSTMDIAKHLYRVAVKPNAAFEKTGLIRKGVAHCSLPSALKLMGGMVAGQGQQQEKDVRALFLAAVRHSLHHRKIKAIPWGTNKPKYDHWILIRDDADDEPMLEAGNLTVAELDERSGILNAREAELADASSPWTMSDVRIKDLAAYATRLIAPLDFSVGEGGNNRYAIAAHTSFRYNNPLDKYLLFVAWILSRSCPSVYHNPHLATTYNHTMKSQSSAELTKLAREMEWVAPPNPKGLKDRTVYWRMAAIYFLAMTNPRSMVLTEARQPVPPDERRKGKGSLKGLPAEWTGKFSESSTHSPTSTYS